MNLWKRLRELFFHCFEGCSKRRFSAENDLKRNRCGEFENVRILVAIGVNEDGYRGVIGVAEGMKDDKISWLSFLQWLKGRGLEGVRLIIGDKCLGRLEAAAEVFPQAKYQR